MPKHEKVDSVRSVLDELYVVQGSWRVFGDSSQPLPHDVIAWHAEHLGQLLDRLDVLDLKQRCNDAVRPRREKSGMTWSISEA